MAIFENSRLTKRAIDALEPRAKTFIAFDADVAGYGVRVMPSGLKSFVLEYRPGAGGRNVNKRRMTLGRYGAMTPDQARRAALSALAHVRLGADPQAEKSRQRTTLTVAGLIDAFLADRVAKLKPNTRAAYAEFASKGAPGAWRSQGGSADPCPGGNPASIAIGCALCGKPDGRRRIEFVWLGGK